MNKFIIDFLNNIEKESIKYCHFKSNNKLDLALSGIDDLDLLIDLNDGNKFLKLLSNYGFKEAYDKNEIRNPYIFHFFGLDKDTGLILHLHIYFKLITGGSIFKNTWIPLENYFLLNPNKDKKTGVAYANYETDLLLFLIRKSIEQVSIIEHYLFIRDFKNIFDEYKWLKSKFNYKKFNTVLKKSNLNIPESLMDQLLNDFITANTFKRILIGYKVSKFFKFNLMNNLKAEVIRFYLFLKNYINYKFLKKKSSRFLFPGGLIIAFVGPEAAGKSTISKNINSWLSERFSTQYIHMGKPKKSYKTKSFWLMIKLYSKLKNHLVKIIKKKNDNDLNDKIIKLNMPRPTVALLDSIDRNNVLLKATKNLLNGAFIITDRYPSKVIDGPRIIPKSKIDFILSKLEIHNYSLLPDPDLVFHIKAPLNITIDRNNKRKFPEPESFIIERYKQSERIKFNKSKTYQINTEKPLEENLNRIKNIIWGEIYK